MGVTTNTSQCRTPGLALGSATRALPTPNFISYAPSFSAIPLLIVIFAKPLADIFFEVNAVKYGYMALLFYTAYIAKCGLLLGGKQDVRRMESTLTFVWWIVFYTLFLLCITIAYGGALQEIFKVVSPFIFFAVIAFAADRWLALALAGGAALIVLANAALLPTSFGWINWGDVHTFKGFYYFKTDLSYSLSFAVLILAAYFRYKSHPLLFIFVIVAAIQVVLANSRLNYLTFGLVVIFIAIKGGLKLRAIASYGVLFALLILVALLTYDSSKLLGFDMQNSAAFTQGRDSVWEHIITALPTFTPLQWLSGRGMFGDILLSVEDTTRDGMAHNAHNEYLHLIYTQGIIGTVVYIVLWNKMFRIAHADPLPGWLRGTGIAAIIFLALQGMTAVVSSYATKTWPVVMVLVLVRALSSVEDTRGNTGMPK